MKKVLAYIILSMVICGSIFASDFYTNKEVKETSPQVKDFVMVFRDPEGGEIWVPTPPTESTIKVTTTGTFHTWDKEGRLGIKTFSQSTEPTTTDLPLGLFCFWIDTDDSKLYICYNAGGTVKTVEMT